MFVSFYVQVLSNEHASNSISEPHVVGNEFLIPDITFKLDALNTSCEEIQYLCASLSADDTSEGVTGGDTENGVTVADTTKSTLIGMSDADKVTDYSISNPSLSISIDNTTDDNIDFLSTNNLTSTLGESASRSNANNVTDDVGVENTRKVGRNRRDVNDDSLSTSATSVSVSNATYPNGDSMTTPITPSTTSDAGETTNINSVTVSMSDTTNTRPNSATASNDNTGDTTNINSATVSFDDAGDAVNVHGTTASSGNADETTNINSATASMGGVGYTTPSIGNTVETTKVHSATSRIDTIDADDTTNINSATVNMGNVGATTNVYGTTSSGNAEDTTNINSATVNMGDVGYTTVSSGNADETTNINSATVSIGDVGDTTNAQGATASSVNADETTNINSATVSIDNFDNVRNGVTVNVYSNSDITDAYSTKTSIGDMTNRVIPITGDPGDAINVNVATADMGNHFGASNGATVSNNNVGDAINEATSMQGFDDIVIRISTSISDSGDNKNIAPASKDEDARNKEYMTTPSNFAICHPFTQCKGNDSL